MKQKIRILLLILFTVHYSYGQDEKPTHAIFSAFTSAPHSGIIYEVERITTYGPCVTVHYREIHVPGIVLPVVTDYEEHLSLPLISEEFQYIDSVNQFGDPVPALFLWQRQTFESTPCPIQFIVAPPSFLLYEAPGAQPMVNTSNRAKVTPDEPAIAGFVLNESTWVIIRGIGPSMRGELETISDPVITLYSDKYLLDDFNDDLENSIRNDNWADTLRKDTLEFWKMSPENENESALVTYLFPGPYTVHLTSKGETGTGLVEVYIAPYSLPLE
ncbi:MAG: hypothetical protein O7C75_12865 [Verrucomicrobia bacterium]|nr:hypothetical protein [Verrucomicrobiota bacterium]